MALTNPPPVRIPSKIAHDPELREFFFKLTRDLYLIWADTRQIYSGAGSPEAVVAAEVGSLYRRLDGGASTTLYVKESGSGSSGWVPK